MSSEQVAHASETKAIKENTTPTVPKGVQTPGWSSAPQPPAVNFLVGGRQLAVATSTSLLKFSYKEVLFTTSYDPFDQSSPRSLQHPLSFVPLQNGGSCFGCSASNLSALQLSKMVSFWPWKGDSSSPASFEKTLSTLSTKITDAQARLDRLRAKSRRLKVLWTLYLGFAYLVYAIVLLLVVGYKDLGIYEWTGMAGGPLLIHTTRAIISAYFTYHIDTTSTHLQTYQDERAKTIQKLKDATKYDSTMELIEKYGGENKKKSQKGGDDLNKTAPNNASISKKSGVSNVRGRTNLPPPPTANIMRPDSPAIIADAKSNDNHQQDQQTGAEFAPNAFTNPPPAPRNHHQQYMTPEAHWYDRIFDVLLGEDETAAKNRYALICHACRLVNGQAPPGTKTLAEVGMWKCCGCGATNGEKDEGKRIVEEVLASTTTDGTESATEGDAPESQNVGGETVGESSTSSATDGPAEAVKTRRRRGKQGA
ncbi:hypothetical protein E4U46_007854 [Claviceps purpurea]|nr:hypothetical protein E4U46_007854 [Claviceps purpurea]